MVKKEQTWYTISSAWTVTSAMAVRRGEKWPLECAGRN